ncbi:MAG TPA: hypothetical protein PLT66_08015, partial [Bacillota bacterium]|nr:hypothetical protein [Bacillota bacterium]
PVSDKAKADVQPQLIEIRKSKKTGFWFGVQSVFSTLIGCCGIILPQVYSMLLGWRIALGIIGVLIAISGVSTFCMITAENIRLNKRKKVLLYKSIDK